MQRSISCQSSWQSDQFYIDTYKNKINQPSLHQFGITVHSTYPWTSNANFHKTSITVQPITCDADACIKCGQQRMKTGREEREKSQSNTCNRTCKATTTAQKKHHTTLFGPNTFKIVNSNLSGNRQTNFIWDGHCNISESCKTRDK